MITRNVLNYFDLSVRVLIFGMYIMAEYFYKNTKEKYMEGFV